MPDKWVLLSPFMEKWDGKRQLWGRRKGRKSTFMKLILLSVAGKTLPGLITGDLSLSAMNLPRVPLAIMHSAPLFIRAKL